MPDVREMTIEQQINMRRNCARVIAEDTCTEQKRRIGQQRIDEVNAYWEELVRHAENLQMQIHMLPVVGMMTTMHYHVGHNGAPEKVRRKILREIIEQPLPFVHTPMYMSEWGTPNSPDRFYKVCNFLRGQINNPPGNVNNFELAITHWQHDLEYVENTWGHLANV